MSSITKLKQTITELEERMGEIRSQMHSEHALYGDSWPGSVEQLSNLQAARYELYQQLSAAYGRRIRKTTDRDSWYRTWRNVRLLARQQIEPDCSEYRLTWLAYTLLGEREMPYDSDIQWRLAIHKGEDVPF